MWTNYLKIALRSLCRHWSYALLNIVGLAVGLAVCFVIGLFIRQELSYDRYHPNADRIYRLIQVNETSGSRNATTPPGLPSVLPEQFPQVQAATVLERGPSSFRRNFQERALDLGRVFETGPSFTDIFPYRFIRGSPTSALSGPRNIVLTQSTAERLFPDRNPLGETLYTLGGDSDTLYEITGVIEDVPVNTHVPIDALVSDGRVPSTVDWSVFGGTWTYVLLREGADPDQFEEQLVAYEMTHKEEHLQDSHLALQPITDIHLHSADMHYTIAPQSDVRYLYLFGAIGALILLIAAVNYMNLATARSITRGREIGIRKAVGAGRRQLVGQFLGEALLVSLLALPLALVLASVALPLASRMAGQELALGSLASPWMIATVGLIVVGVGVLSGSYPAFVLARFRPAQILTGRGLATRGGSDGLRRGLVVFQFSVALLLVISAFVVQSQLSYLQEKRLGFDEEHVVILTVGGITDHFEAFRQMLLESPHVASVSYGSPPGYQGAFRRTGHEDRDTGERWELQWVAAGPDFAETAGLNLLAGRSFENGGAADSLRPVLINESAAERFGIAGDPIGQRILSGRRARTVIGVVEDYHTESLREPIGPVIIEHVPAPGPGRVFARLHPGDIPAGLAVMEEAYEQLVDDRPFEYAFLSDRLARQYGSERRLGGLFTVFAGLAVFVACLGLMGLMAFMAESRAKEIGIRKTVGATVTNIVGLLSRDFLRLIGISLLLASPVAYFAMNRWLENFAYPIDLGLSTFLGAGGLTVVLALLAVSYQAIKAALTDPAESLRYE